MPLTIAVRSKHTSTLVRFFAQSIVMGLVEAAAAPRMRLMGAEVEQLEYPRTTPVCVDVK
jgi:hypothetical protein